MSKLDEFNASISTLQQEVENLQAIENAYKQLAKLVQDYDTVIQNLNTATHDMTTTKGELVKQSSSVSEKLIEQKRVLETATTEQRKELETKLKNLQTLVEEKQNELQTQLNENADEISSANKKFYTEFAESVKVRLDNNKLEIKQLIDQDANSTRQQIATLQTEYTNQTMKLQHGINDTQNVITKRICEMQTAIAQQLLIQKKISLVFGITIMIFAITAIVLHVVLR